MNQRDVAGAMRLTGVAATLVLAGTALGRGPVGPVGEAGIGGAFVEIKLPEAGNNGSQRSSGWVKVAGSWVDIEMGSESEPTTRVFDILWTRMLSSGGQVRGDHPFGSAPALKDAASVGGSGGASRGRVLGGPVVSRVDISRPIVSDAVAIGGKDGSVLWGGTAGAEAKLAVAGATLSEILGVSDEPTNAFAAVGAPRWTGPTDTSVASRVRAVQMVWGVSAGAAAYQGRRAEFVGGLSGLDGSGFGPLSLEGSGVSVLDGTNPFKATRFYEPMFQIGPIGTGPGGGGIANLGTGVTRPGNGDGDSTSNVPGPGAAVVLGLGGLIGAGRRRR